MTSWISQETLDQHIDHLSKHAAAAREHAAKRRRRNVIDPFSSLVLASTLGIREPERLVGFQEVESMLRGASNALGEFHQRVLGSVKGWRNHDAGYDLECVERKILAEVKNKHNTMNAANRREVVSDLETALRQKKGHWEAYLVLIIPKTPRRYKKQLAPRLFEIDGSSFYELVTGEPNALHELLNYMLDKISPTNEIADHCRRIMKDSLPPTDSTEVLHRTSTDIFAAPVNTPK